MPRIYDSANDPHDFCRRHGHWPTEREAVRKFGNVGNGPDNRGNCFGYDAEHPDYDGEDYACEVCNKTLTSKDN